MNKGYKYLIIYVKKVKIIFFFINSKLLGSENWRKYLKMSLQAKYKKKT